MGQEVLGVLGNRMIERTCGQDHFLLNPQPGPKHQGRWSERIHFSCSGLQCEKWFTGDDVEQSKDETLIKSQVNISGGAGLQVGRRDMPLPDTVSLERSDCLCVLEGSRRRTWPRCCVTSIRVATSLGPIIKLTAL